MGTAAAEPVSGLAAAAVFTTREALDQLAARDGLVLSLAVEHLFDARVIALMELIETDGLAAGSDHAAGPETKRSQRRSGLSRSCSGTHLRSGPEDKQGENRTRIGPPGQCNETPIHSHCFGERGSNACCPQRLGGRIARGAATAFVLCTAPCATLMGRVAVAVLSYWHTLQKRR